jgi:benzoate membrane transport protein
MSASSAAPAAVITPPPSLAQFWRNLRDLPGSLTLSTVTAGFIVALIGYTGPILIVLQAAQAAGLSPEQTASWAWAIAVGNGLFTMLLSLTFRQPITSPWSTAGAALLVSSLGAFSYPEAVGAYMAAAVGIALVGVSGLFGRIMAQIPRPVVMGVLAGILLQFGLNIFTRLPENPAIVLSMLAVFFLLRRVRFQAPTLGAMAVGIVVAAVQGALAFGPLSLAPTVPVFTAPAFTPGALLSLAMPLFVLALTSQYAPGEAVLRANGYTPPINRILTVTGLGTLALSVFGNHGTTLGALTAAIVTGPDCHPDAARRYAGAFVSGLCYFVFGIFGTTIIGLFSGFPAVFVSTVAGLSLSGVIAGSLAGALEQPAYRDAAIVAFLCTAGGFTLLGIGAPFWGLVAGIGTHLILTLGRRA